MIVASLALELSYYSKNVGDIYFTKVSLIRGRSTFEHFNRSSNLVYPCPLSLAAQIRTPHHQGGGRAKKPVASGSFSSAGGLFSLIEM